MEVILLENMRNLGKFGATVKVASGFGRNYLIPQKKAVPANKVNIARFEAQRHDLEKAATGRLQSAQARADKLNAMHLVISAHAAEEGKLYGSIGTSELAKAFKDKGADVSRQEIRLPNGALKELGEFNVQVHLHAEVIANVKVTIKADKA